MRQLHPTPAGRTLLLAAALLFTAACSGGSGSGSVAGGGNAGGNQAKFVWEDLNGDWIGQLTPAPLASGQPHNAYLRWVDLRLTEAAESGGLEFVAANSTRSFKFSGKGVLSADLKALVGSARLLLNGQMDESAAVLEGSFRLTDADGSEITGDFLFTRSAGPAQFTQDMLARPWDGLGRNGTGKFRFLKFELDAAGVVISGLMRHPDTEVKIRDYSAGSATFVFADTSIGRINDVVMTSDQGETLTFPFLLLDADATLLAGAGVESELGDGIGELVPGL
jgi:hypothetical protein